MPPRPIPLAYAGKKLIGPPEGYDRKKELQVKKWLTNIPADQASDLAASVATLSEVNAPTFCRFCCALSNGHNMQQLTQMHSMHSQADGLKPTMLFAVGWAY